MKNIKTWISLTLAICVTFLVITQVASENTATKAEVEPTSEVILMSEVEWRPLNPARGDQINLK